MTEKEFNEFLKQQAHKTDFTDKSFYVSSKDDKGNSEWKHYRFYDTSTTIFSGTPWWMWVISILVMMFLNLIGCVN